MLLSLGLSRRLPSPASLRRLLPIIRNRMAMSTVSEDSESISPTSKVRSKHAFEEAKLLDYLKTQGVLKGLISSYTFRQFSHGQSNPTFILEGEKKSPDDLGGEILVIRKQPPGKLLKGAHAVDREYRVMSALYNHNYSKITDDLKERGTATCPIPHPLLFCSDAAVIGTPFFCYEFVRGRFFKAPQLTSVSHLRKRAMYESMLDTLARLHSVDVDEAGLGDYGARAGSGLAETPQPGAESPQPSNHTQAQGQSKYVHRQIRTWTKQYRASETESIPEMEELITRLPALLPAGAEEHSCLVHGDYRLDNMIFREDSDSVAAVLDWELSTLGDGLSDLAYFSMAYYLDPTNPFLKGVRGLDLGSEGIPSLSEVVQIYGQRLELHSKGRMKGPKAGEVDYYLAFSFFRACAILQGVYKRSLQGNASAENADLTLAFAKETAQLGLELLNKYEKENAVHISGAGGGGFSSSRPLQAKSIIPSSLLFGNMVSPKAHSLLKLSADFITDRVMPAESTVLAHTYTSPNKWTDIHPQMIAMKAEAKGAGLWNLFMPIETDEGRYGAGLTNLEYALICEMTGRSLIAPELFNCSAPDTGNMEVLARYGTEAQKDRWLMPLLQGDIRSCFAMTEPDVASSDATNMESTVALEGQEVVLSGSKWWTSGAMDPRCKVAIFMGRTKGDLSDTPKHMRHSMVLVPMDTPGVRVLRPLTVMGYDDAPHGHAEMRFEDVRVPKENVILGEGRGFEIAQGRLGPGRIHHCMRLIGMAERALQLMIDRVTSRVAFGKYLAEQGTIQMDIALSRVEINQARLLCLNAAAAMDAGGNKAAKAEIASIKIVAPLMAKRVVDRSMQSMGGLGLSQDTPLAHMWSSARVLQLADGPDEVHIASLAKMLIQESNPSYRPKK